MQIFEFTKRCSMHFCKVLLVKRVIAMFLCVSRVYLPACPSNGFDSETAKTITRTVGGMRYIRSNLLHHR